MNISHLTLDLIWLENSPALLPEVVIPADDGPPPVEHRIHAGLTDYLLDYDQERRSNRTLSRRRSRPSE
jgi:hypothetical protein